MMRIRRMLQAFLRDETGQDVIEYALVAALIGVGAVVSMSSFASRIGASFNSVGYGLTSAV
jgi:pilus assembly protein Flp/PilA